MEGAGDMVATQFNWRWMNLWAVAVTASPWWSPVTSMDVDSPLIQFFCVSKKRVVAHASRKAWSRALYRMTQSELWNCRSWKWN